MSEYIDTVVIAAEYVEFKFRRTHTYTDMQPMHKSMHK